jgi:mono/diheme cytochrome c family protein
MSRDMSRVRSRSATLMFVALAAMTACKLDSRDDYLGDKDPRQYSLGHPAAAATIAAENIDVSANGAGLPPGSGTPEQGATVFAASCASCHGKNGEGTPPLYPQLVGGPPAANFDSDFKIPRTIGNYWPYATTLFDYVRRAMPLTAPQSLSNDDVYAVSAYVLYLNGLVPDSAVVDGKALTALRMPNRDGFVGDPRPDVKNADCMTNCAK